MREAVRRPLTSRLLVTDCGFFSAATEHERVRPDGTDQAVLIVCADGEGWCRLPSGHLPVKAGQALLIPPGMPHAYGASATHPWTIWWLHLTRADAAELIDAALEGGDPVVNVNDLYRAVSLVADALRRMERDDSIRSLRAAAGAAWHLLALLAADRAGVSTTRAEAVQQAQDYLRENIGSRVSVADLAALARLSPSHFATLFRRTTGVGVLRYQTRLRMSRARELLDNTDLPTSEIASTLGYTDPFYFSRQIRAVHGLPPTDYRSHHKG